MPRRTVRQHELDELHEQQERERARELAVVRKRLAQALANAQGFERLRAITDEEWEEAMTAGEQPEVGGGA